jgi:hypothetical protein
MATFGGGQKLQARITRFARHVMQRIYHLETDVRPLRLLCDRMA